MDGIQPPGMQIAPLAGALGAEITGVDLTGLDQDGFDQIYRAFLEYQVLVFRDQDLTAADYTALANRFGTPVPYPFAKGIDGHPEITIIAKEAHQTSNFGGMWHSDTTYKPGPTQGDDAVLRRDASRGWRHDILMPIQSPGRVI